MTDVVKVDVRRIGRRFEAEAVLDLAADAQTVWDTITDYGALPQFMPGIRACRVVERQAIGQRAQVQFGIGQLAQVGRPFEVQIDGTGKRLRQEPRQGGLSALARPKQSHRGRLAQILDKLRLNRSYHA